MADDWIDLMIGSLGRHYPPGTFETYQVTGRISRLAARLAQQEERVFGEFGLNRGEVGVLAALRATPENRLSPTQLFRGLMLSSAGMTSRLDRLEKRRLVKRRRDPKDRRGILVELTPGGKELLDRVLVENTKAEAVILDGLGDKDRQQLTKILRKLLTAVESPSGE